MLSLDCTAIQTKQHVNKRITVIYSVQELYHVSITMPKAFLDKTSGAIKLP